MEIFKLFGSVFVNTDEAEKSLSKTDKKAGGLATSMGKGIASVGKFALGVGAAAAAGGAALFGMANNAAGATDRIDKMSQKLGMSRQAFQEWDFIASQSGMSVEQLSAGMKGLATKMDDAANGGKNTSAMFDRLGISIQDSDGKLRSQEEVFEEAVTRLQEMEDGTEKAALATELFGKSGVELMPLLNGASGSVEEMKQKAAELGLILSDDAVDAGVVFTDTLDQLTRSFEGVVTQVGVAVMPMIQTFMDWIISNMPTIQLVVETVFGAIQFFVQLVADTFAGATSGMNLNWETFAAGLQYVWDNYGQPLFDALMPLIQAFAENWDVIWATAQSLFQTTWEIIKGLWETIGKPVFDLIVELIGIVASVFAEYMPEITSFFNSMASDIKVIWETSLKPAFDAIKAFIENVLAPAFKFVFENGIRAYVESTFNFIKSIWENTLKPVLTGIGDFLTGVFTGNFSQAFNGIKTIVEGVMNGLVAIVKYPLNVMIGLVNGFIGGLNKVKVPDWVPGLGGKGINMPTIPLLAKGGHVFGDGNAIVGEAGPELLTKTAKGVKVTPLSSEEKSKGISGALNTDKQAEIIINLDGYTIAKAIVDVIDMLQGRKIKTKTFVGGARA